MTFQVGEWISCKSSDGREWSSKVTAVKEIPGGYECTVQQFPDEIYPAWIISEGKWTLDDE